MGKIRALFSRSRRSKKSSPSSRRAPPPSASPSPSTRHRALQVPEDEVARVFSKFDANGDGRISSTELAALFGSLGHAATDDEVARMMEEADADGDGYISLPEFAAVSAPPAGDDEAVEEDLRQAFRVYDADGNGLICPAELARVLRGLGEQATVAQCRRMIQGVDRNGDGLVSFDEFKLMMAGGGGFGSVAS